MSVHPHFSALLRTIALLIACSAVDAQLRHVDIAAEAASPLANPRVFVARYDPSDWSGDVTAQRFADSDDHAPLWSAASLLDARSDAAIAERLVLSADEHGLGIPLQWSALSASMRAALALQGWDARRLAFLRGVRREAAASGGRTRAPRLGDILNANLWFSARRAPTGTTRKPMVFAGANDGMLHGFDAEDGSEVLAYVPIGLLPRLAVRRHAGAAHAYGVDGPVFTGDAPLGVDGAPMTVLVGALGAGGKGFFLLDVSAHQLFSAGSAVAIVLLDASAGRDADIGQIFSPPVVDGSDPNRSLQIVQMNNRRWAVVMGNGYFSTGGKPVLLIQYLDGARELHKLSPCATTDAACAFAGDNGLSAPRLIDANGDGMVDLAYAGDLQGHVWKFDLSSRNAAGGIGANWRVGFSGQPFFVARDAEGRRQPITTAPYWIPHPLGGVMLAIGTGRHLSPQDRALQDPQTIYGLYDDSAMTPQAGAIQITDTSPIFTTTAARPTSLVQQQYGQSAAVDGTTYHYASSEPVAYTGADKRRGWWIDLPHAGQRVLQHPRSFEGQKVLVHSVIPTVTTATSAALPWNTGTPYLSIVNILTGHPPVQPAFAPADARVIAAGIGMASTPSGPALVLRKGASTQLRYPASQRVELRNSQTVGARASWREHH